jgi:hypothetical protein
MDSGIINIRGKEYQTVALRVQKFRAAHPAWTIRSEIVHIDADQVLMRAEILDETGRLLADGFAEEWRASSQINKTSAVENCQTSAIGRALACTGFGGSEFASADELANALRHQSAVVATPPAAQDVMAAAMARIAAANDAAALGEVGAGLAKLEVDEASKKKLRAAFTARRKALEAA